VQHDPQQSLPESHGPPMGQRHPVTSQVQTSHVQISQQQSVEFAASDAAVAGLEDRVITNSIAATAAAASRFLNIVKSPSRVD
jgi:hypothetical protein